MANDLHTLLELARKTAGSAYAPYSGFHVGSALRTDNGAVFAGCNVEIANHKAICAEGNAITSMIAAGERKIIDIVVVGPNDDLCTPCGDCRQRIREFADMAQTRIHVFANSGTHLKTYTMEELLPDSFGPENLKP